MWLRKLQGGTSIGPYSWPGDGSLCEVPDQIGSELIALGGYEKADVPDVGGEEGAEPAKLPRRRKPADAAAG